MVDLLNPYLSHELVKYYEVTMIGGGVVYCLTEEHRTPSDQDCPSKNVASKLAYISKLDEIESVISGMMLNNWGLESSSYKLFVFIIIVICFITFFGLILLSLQIIIKCKQCLKNRQIAS